MIRLPNPSRLEVNFLLFKDADGKPIEQTVPTTQAESDVVIIDVVVWADEISRSETKFIVNGNEATSKVFAYRTNKLEFNCSSARCSIVRLPLPQ